MTKQELMVFVTSYREKIEQASAWTDDADALEMIELFPLWSPDREVIVSERLQYGGKLYKCIQAHTTQIDWTPDKTPALWVEVSVEEFPEWKQPSGAADAYRIGDKVTFENERYLCISDYNVYPPNVYGWNKV